MYEKSIPLTRIGAPQATLTGTCLPRCLNFFSCCIGGRLKEHHVDLSYLLMGSALGVLICGLLLFLVKLTQFTHRPKS